MSSTLLVVDADAHRREELRAILQFLDHKDEQSVDCVAWRDIPADEPVVAVVLGAGRSNDEVDEPFHAVKTRYAHTPFIVLRGDKEAYLPREIELGVLAVVDAPVKYRQLSNALQQVQLFYEANRQAPSKRPPELFRSLVGNSRSIRQVRKRIEQGADSDATVLILRESGTGKEVVARNLHYHSARRNKPFVPINCGAIPAELLESELFGHEKGVFFGVFFAWLGCFVFVVG